MFREPEMLSAIIIRIYRSPEYGPVRILCPVHRHFTIFGRGTKDESSGALTSRRFDANV
jgi:hypothetical protein